MIARQTMRLSVLMPVYNERATIAEAVVLSMRTPPLSMKSVVILGIYGRLSSTT